jgi:hypothetical protein
VIHYHGGDDSLLLDQSEARDKIRDALPFAIAEPPADWMVQRRNDATTQPCGTAMQRGLLRRRTGVCATTRRSCPMSRLFARAADCGPIWASP